MTTTPQAKRPKLLLLWDKHENTLDMYMVEIVDMVSKDMLDNVQWTWTWSTLLLKIASSFKLAAWLCCTKMRVCATSRPNVIKPLLVYESIENEKQDLLVAGWGGREKSKYHSCSWKMKLRILLPNYPQSDPGWWWDLTWPTKRQIRRQWQWKRKNTLGENFQRAFLQTCDRNSCNVFLGSALTFFGIFDLSLASSEALA